MPPSCPPCGTFEEAGVSWCRSSRCPPSGTFDEVGPCAARRPSERDLSSRTWPISAWPCGPDRSRALGLSQASVFWLRPSTISRLSLGSTRRPSALRRSEEHTSELQSQSNLVCRLLLEKKKKKQTSPTSTL